MMSCNRWVPSLVVFILATLFPLVFSQFERVVCSTSGNYTSESLYRADLSGILRSLSSNINNTGFYSSSAGRANVVSLCRADVQLNQCRGCVNSVADAILVNCPNQFEAIMWSEFCMVRYSNKNLFGTLAILPARILYSGANSTSPVGFKAAREKLMEDVRARAAGSGSLRKAAAENTTGPDGQGIFILLQCTPDLSPENCISCLVEAAGYIPEYIDDSTGIRVYTPSCIYRNEDKSFYNITKLDESLAPALTPPLAPPPLLPPSSVPPSLVPPPPPAKSKNVKIIIVVPVVAFIFLALGVGIFVLKRILKHKANEMINPEFSGEISTTESIQHDFGKIKSATNNFSDDNKLGQGGFGAVYMGKMVSGQEIAVKRLSKDSGQGDMEFKNEVLLLAKLQHRNLVRLLGFSIQGVERLLVYEFVSNGSLDQILFVALDATIECTNRIVGTFGYMAPEYTTDGKFSVKSDVFSFGVIVLEIITGQRKIFVRNGEKLGELLSYAWRSWREGTTADIVDPILMETCGAQPDMMKCIHIALLCVQPDADDRPTMASVAVMLGSSTITLPIPKEPGFSFSGTSAPHPEYSSNQIESSTTQSTQYSNYTYSTTSDLYPRT
ncbi:hypothetical protein ABFX02_03G033000 [Erythranthe guttata]